jgi:hypothetical protein
LRASSLSNDKVVSLLNRYFVPVYARNGDYRPAKGQADGATVVPPAERAEYFRIYHEALQAKLSTGTVHVYILDPAGHPIDSLHVARATDPERLAALLESAVTKLKVHAGPPLVAPCCQAQAPVAEPGSLVLHLTARYLQRQGDDYVRPRPVLGTERSGQWGALPSEDWIVLPRAEWLKLLPAAARPGTHWDVDPAVAARVLTHFFPPTENTDIRTNRIDELVLRGKVLSVKAGIVLARLEGRFKMKHPFYHRDTDEFVATDMVGLLEYESGRPAIRSLRLVTDRATYGGKTGTRQPFGVAVRSLPPAATSN